MTFSASGPPGLTFAFDPPKIASPGNGATTLTLGTTEALTEEIYTTVTVTASGGGTSSSTKFQIHVFCDPPLILGLNQPRSTTIRAGQTAQIDVTPSGSGTFRYQWYLGHKGSTIFPVDGATGKTLTTPPLSFSNEFWVRVTNGCGTVDSENATVNVNP